MDIKIQKKIAKLVGYRGRNIKLVPFSPMSLNSYWDGGSRNYFYFVNLNTFQVNQVPQNGTPFDRANLKADTLPDGNAIVEVSIFRGKTVSCRIYI